MTARPDFQLHKFDRWRRYFLVTDRLSWYQNYSNGRQTVACDTFQSSTVGTNRCRRMERMSGHENHDTFWNAQFWRLKTHSPGLWEGVVNKACKLCTYWIVPHTLCRTSQNCYNEYLSPCRSNYYIKLRFRRQRVSHNLRHPGPHHVFTSGTVSSLPKCELRELEIPLPKCASRKFCSLMNCEFRPQIANPFYI